MQCRLPRRVHGGAAVYVRLTCKLADRLDGVDVSRVRLGDVIDVADADGQMLIAEGWAERVHEKTADDPRPDPQT